MDALPILICEECCQPYTYTTSPISAGDEEELRKFLTSIPFTCPNCQWMKTAKFGLLFPPGMFEREGD